MYADPTFIEIAAWNNLSETFCQNISWSPNKWKLSQTIFFKSENCFCMRFRTFSIFWNRKLNLAYSEVREKWPYRSASHSPGEKLDYLQLVRNSQNSRHRRRFPCHRRPPLATVKKSTKYWSWNFRRAIRIPIMCLVLKFDSGNMVSISHGQTDERTEPPNTVLVYRFIFLRNLVIFVSFRSRHNVEFLLCLKISFIDYLI